MEQNVRQRCDARSQRIVDIRGAQEVTWGPFKLEFAAGTMFIHADESMEQFALTANRAF